MSTFEELADTLEANWTTILVGWTGLGALSPWPNRWIEFPSLISAEEIAAYAEARLAASPDLAERRLITALLSSELRTENREAIKDLLEPLSNLSGGDLDVELRKWRLVLLEEALEKMPEDVLQGLAALSEFWQSFGFPCDSPHEVQGRGNTVCPAEYYRQENLDRLIARHHAWIQDEKAALGWNARRSS